MKICEILLFGIMIGTEGRKTPFERRLLKTFNILNTWGNQHLDGHEHFLVKLADKDNKVGHAKNASMSKRRRCLKSLSLYFPESQHIFQTKFKYKRDKLTKKIRDVYLENLKEWILK